MEHWVVYNSVTNQISLTTVTVFWVKKCQHIVISHHDSYNSNMTS